MIPNTLAEFLSSNKERTLLNGYLRVLTEEEQTHFTNMAAPVLAKQGTLTVFAVTAFADLLAWDGNFVYMLRLTEGNTDVILSGFTFFFDNLVDPEYQKEFFDIELYEEVLIKLGKTSNAQIYAFEPIPILGGTKTADSAKIVDLDEYLSFLISLNS